MISSTTHAFNPETLDFNVYSGEGYPDRLIIRDGSCNFIHLDISDIPFLEAIVAKLKELESAINEAEARACERVPEIEVPF